MLLKRRCSCPVEPATHYQFGAWSITMATRCKPGDIAVIIYDEPDCLANVGRLVRVHPTLQLNLELNLFCWLIEPLEADPWHVSEADGHISVKVINASSQVEHPDVWMLPIKDELPDKQEHTEQSVSGPGREPAYVMSEEEYQAYARMQERIDEALIADGSIKPKLSEAFVANPPVPHTINAGSMRPSTSIIQSRGPDVGRGFFDGICQEAHSLKLRFISSGGGHECR